MSRAAPDAVDDLVATTAVTPSIIRGRAMSGWLRVASEELQTDELLLPWIERALAYVGTLPPKT